MGASRLRQEFHSGLLDRFASPGRGGWIGRGLENPESACRRLLLADRIQGVLGHLLFPFLFLLGKGRALFLGLEVT